MKYKNTFRDNCFRHQWSDEMQEDRSWQLFPASVDLWNTEIQGHISWQLFPASVDWWNTRTHFVTIVSGISGVMKYTNTFRDICFQHQWIDEMHEIQEHISWQLVPASDPPTHSPTHTSNGARTRPPQDSAQDRAQDFWERVKVKSYNFSENCPVDSFLSYPFSGRHVFVSDPPTHPTTHPHLQRRMFGAS